MVVGRPEKNIYYMKNTICLDFSETRADFVYFVITYDLSVGAGDYVCKGVASWRFRGFWV